MQRFGYLDGDSNYSLVYETGENDNTLYPGNSVEITCSVYCLKIIVM